MEETEKNSIKDAFVVIAMILNCLLGVFILVYLIKANWSVE